MDHDSSFNELLDMYCIYASLPQGDSPKNHLTEPRLDPGAGDNPDYDQDQDAGCLLYLSPKSNQGDGKRPQQSQQDAIVLQCENQVTQIGDDIDLKQKFAQDVNPVKQSELIVDNTISISQSQETHNNPFQPCFQRGTLDHQQIKSNTVRLNTEAVQNPTQQVAQNVPQTFIVSEISTNSGKSKGRGRDAFQKNAVLTESVRLQTAERVGSSESSDSRVGWGLVAAAGLVSFAAGWLSEM